MATMGVEVIMRSLRARLAVNTVKFLVVVGVVLFASAGTLHFWEAWLFLGFNLVWWTVTGSYFMKKDPAFVERRLAQEERGEREAVQKVVMAVLRVLGVITLVLAGLDHRFAWSAAPIWVVATGGALFVAGAAVVFAAFVENAYASSIIEVDAAQTVVVTGLYRVLRHPMYSGTLLMGLATPLMLGSYAALLLLPPGWALLVVRILAEERFLAHELRGYEDYMRRTSSRLIPGVW
jgi:protein-S-isoprenylcysteine O-methyltransferase Ste14